MTCPFCNIEKNSKQVVVLENELCYFLQEPQKVLIGSGIIIPKAHRETVFELTTEEWNSTFSLLLEAKNLIDDDHQPDGYNIGWNNGVVAGQEIFHVHLHVIPRFKAEPYSGKGIRHWIKQRYNKRE